MVLNMFFFTVNNVDVHFNKQKLTWRPYITAKALLTTQKVEFIHRNEFAKMVLDKKIKAFVIYVSSLKLRITIHLARKTQITLLLAKKVTIPAKYTDFADVFSKKSANVFSKQIRANEPAIKLEQAKQPSYGPIYSLEPVEFKTLKTYIKTNLAISFIKASKLPASTLILFNHKPNSSFYLCVNN